jgi:hypothetical protein
VIPAGRPRDDSGTSLAELLVSMGVMSVVGALATTGLVQMLRITGATEQRAVAQSSVGTALMRIDRQVRYSSALGRPYALDGATRIEYEVVETGTVVCQQLRHTANRQLLQQRRWIRGATPPAPSPWTTLATDVTAVTFARIDATDTRGFQRLSVTISVGGQRGRTSSVTFTAMNTDAGTAGRSPQPCSEGSSLP